MDNVKSIMINVVCFSWFKLCDSRTCFKEFLLLTSYWCYQLSQQLFHAYIGCHYCTISLEKSQDFSWSAVLTSSAMTSCDHSSLVSSSCVASSGESKRKTIYYYFHFPIITILIQYLRETALKYFVVGLSYNINSNNCFTFRIL